MTNFLQKTYHTTEDTERQLIEISEALGHGTKSSSIRYCVKQVYDELINNNRKEASA